MHKFHVHHRKSFFYVPCHKRNTRDYTRTIFYARRYPSMTELLQVVDSFLSLSYHSLVHASTTSLTTKKFSVRLMNIQETKRSSTSSIYSTTLHCFTSIPPQKSMHKRQTSGFDVYNFSTYANDMSD